MHHATGHTLSPPAQRAIALQLSSFRRNCDQFGGVGGPKIVFLSALEGGNRRKYVIFAFQLSSNDHTPYQHTWGELLSCWGGDIGVNDTKTASSAWGRRAWDM